MGGQETKEAPGRASDRFGGTQLLVQDTWGTQLLVQDTYYILNKIHGADESLIAFNA